MLPVQSIQKNISQGVFVPGVTILNVALALSGQSLTGVYVAVTCAVVPAPLAVIVVITWPAELVYTVYCCWLPESCGLKEPWSVVRTNCALGTGSLGEPPVISVAVTVAEPPDTIQNGTTVTVSISGGLIMTLTLSLNGIPCGEAETDSTVVSVVPVESGWM